MITNDKLLELKKITSMAKPFTDKDKAAHTWEEMSDENKRRARANADFFLMVHPVLPDLIDEILEHRNK